MSSVLFYHGSNFSYVFSTLANGFDFHCAFFEISIHFSTHIGEFILVEKVYRHFLVTFSGSNLYRFEDG